MIPIEGLTMCVARNRIKARICARPIPFLMKWRYDLSWRKRACRRKFPKLPSG